MAKDGIFIEDLTFLSHLVSGLSTGLELGLSSLSTGWNWKHITLFLLYSRQTLQ